VPGPGKKRKKKWEHKETDGNFKKTADSEATSLELGSEGRWILYQPGTWNDLIEACGVIHQQTDAGVPALHREALRNH
jgi:hypothetical protein